MPLNNKEVGQRVRIFRKKYVANNGMDAGPALGVTQSALSKIERGDIEISTTVIISLIEKYKCNIYWIFYETGPETTEYVPEVPQITKKEAIERLIRIREQTN